MKIKWIGKEDLSVEKDKEVIIIEKLMKGNKGEKGIELKEEKRGVKNIEIKKGNGENVGEKVEIERENGEKVIENEDIE